MKRKICVVTGSRAEYGLLRWVMEGVKNHPDLVLQVVATGMHLSPEFGNTYTEIEKDGFVIDKKIRILNGQDSPDAIAKAMGAGMIGFSDALAELKPDLLVLLGDRFEIFSAAAVALVARIPIAHIHGGETTEGVIDEAIRHSITKMSHFHFVATETYRKRVVQLGESPVRVFNVGGLGVDVISKLEIIPREQLEDEMQFEFQKNNLIVTFHPVTLEHNSASSQVTELLRALGRFPDLGLIITLPNSDTEGKAIAPLLTEFARKNPKSKVYKSLGSKKFLSCLALVDGVIGNSSSGLLEAPTLRKGTINIGDRQRGRLMATSVIQCEPLAKNIERALLEFYSADFQHLLTTVDSPYGTAGASEKIVNALSQLDLTGIGKKVFHDLEQ